MDDYPAVGGKAAGAAEDSHISCRDGSAHATHVSITQHRPNILLLAFTCTRFEGLSKCRSHVLQTLCSVKCRRYPSRSKCHIVPASWHPAQTFECSDSRQCLVSAYQLSISSDIPCIQNERTIHVSRPPAMTGSHLQKQ
jgi:hypothetical protein